MTVKEYKNVPRARGKIMLGDMLNPWWAKAVNPLDLYEAKEYWV